MIARRHFIKSLLTGIGFLSVGLRWLSWPFGKKVLRINPEWRTAKYERVSGQLVEINHQYGARWGIGRFSFHYARGNKVGDDGKLIEIPWLAFIKRPKGEVQQSGSKKEFFAGMTGEYHQEIHPEPGKTPKITIPIPQLD